METLVLLVAFLALGLSLGLLRCLIGVIGDQGKTNAAVYEALKASGARHDLLSQRLSLYEGSLKSALEGMGVIVEAPNPPREDPS